MKKIISVLVMICWFALPGMAQGGLQPGGQPRRMGGDLEAMKIAFITKRLNLSPEEAQRFWPVYNQYAAEVRQAHQAYRVHKNELILDESILNSKKKFSPEFDKVLSPEKTNEFFRAEKDFGAFVQKEMQRRQMQMRRVENR
ncbi:hypothetical protein ACX0G9_29160 [Flavitalea flava]